MNNEQSAQHTAKEQLRVQQQLMDEAHLLIAKYEKEIKHLGERNKYLEQRINALTVQSAAGSHHTSEELFLDWLQSTAKVCNRGGKLVSTQWDGDRSGSELVELYKAKVEPKEKTIPSEMQSIINRLESVQHTERCPDCGLELSDINETHDCDIYSTVMQYRKDHPESAAGSHGCKVEKITKAGRTKR